MEIIPTIKEEISKIYPLGIKPQTKLVEEEVKIAKMEIHVKTTKPQVDTKPLVVI